ncbi:MAG: Mov34/MPN/PAD-1 family protein [Promethearchaeota archaeon]|jgi:proteasome lid subunit RPN8/RPN11
MKIEKDIVLILNEEIVGKLKDCNRKFSPIESCGLIFGEIKKAEVNEEKSQISYIGKRFYCLKSNVESLGSFILIQDSDRYFEIHQEAVIKNKLRLMSIFHSHPVPAYPSSIDLENMKYLDNDIGSVRNPFKNLIWTIMDMDTEEINSFIYFKNELLQTEMVIRIR